jgi:hypothetical protein
MDHVPRPAAHGHPPAQHAQQQHHPAQGFSSPPPAAQQQQEDSATPPTEDRDEHSPRSGSTPPAQPAWHQQQPAAWQHPAAAAAAPAWPGAAAAAGWPAPAAAGAGPVAVVKVKEEPREEREAVTCEGEGAAAHDAHRAPAHSMPAHQAPAGLAQAARQMGASAARGVGGGGCACRSCAAVGVGSSAASRIPPSPPAGAGRPDQPPLPGAARAGEDCSVPVSLFDLQELSSVLNLGTWREALSEEERQALRELLPPGWAPALTLSRTSLWCRSIQPHIYDAFKGGCACCQLRAAAARRLLGVPGAGLVCAPAGPQAAHGAAPQAWARRRAAPWTSCCLALRASTLAAPWRSSGGTCSRGSSTPRWSSTRSWCW